MKADKKKKNNRIQKAFSVAKWEEDGDLLESSRVILYLWLGIVSVLGWFGHLCNLEFSRAIVFGTALIMVLFFSYLMEKLQENQRKWLCTGLAVIPLVGMIMPPGLRGISGLFHDAYKALSRRGILLFYQGTDVDAVWTKNMVVLFMACFLMLLLYFSYQHAAEKAMVLPFFLMLLVEMRWGRGEGNIWIFLWMIWLAILLMTTVRSYLFAMAPLLVFSILFACVFGISGGKGWQDVWNYWRYGSKSTVLPEGDLMKAGKMDRKDKIAIIVEGDQAGYYYLKGFVGTTYQENAWKADSQMLEDFETGILNGNNEFLSWIHEKGYSGWNELAKMMKAEKDQVITIHNKTANRRYLYLPYELTTTVQELENEKLVVSGAGEALMSTGIRGRKNYRIKTSPSLAGRKISEPQNRGENFGKRKIYDAYEEYVNRTCLTLPKDVKETLRVNLEGSSTLGIDNTMALVRKVRKWVKENVTYNETPGTVPKGEEFTNWFLNGNAGGYDVQYATMAVMLFRYYGIPSRYVEGYLVENTNEISETSAHAWPEIFISGRGWVPVEVMEDYQKKMPSYLAEKGEKVFASEKEMLPEEQEQTQQNTKKEHRGGKSESEDSKKSPILPNFGEEESLLPLILLLTLMVLALIAVLILLFMRFKELYFQRWATESISPERSVIMWYRYCIWMLYEMEEEPVQKAAMAVDNRVLQWEERWIKYHPDVNKDFLKKAGLLRQKAIYYRRGIQWKEAVEVIPFLRSEYRYLFRRLKFASKMKVRLGIRPPFLRRKYER